jgi:hypothetical protein
MAYAAEPSAIVWNANAQVRQPVTTLHYGDRVTILQRSGDRVQVRTDAGVQGWIEVPTLMDADLWQQAAQILARARTLPVQARGHTRTISNVRLTSGRDGPRIFQFGRNEPVVVLDRTTSPAPQEGAGDTASLSADNASKMEYWLLVMRAAPAAPSAETVTGVTASTLPGTSNASSAVPIAGWLLARFIELDPPQPIPDYFSAAGIRVVAWAVLNTVPDNGESHPQYLVAGARGGEGQPCDFTLLRVYTWGAIRQRYETAYIENDVCGRMPIRVASTPAGDEFRFAVAADGKVERVYRMKQTSVRRVTETAATPRSKKR